MPESTDVASADAVNTDAGDLIEPEALDGAVAAARTAFDAAADLAALAAAKPAHLGDRAPVLIRLRLLIDGKPHLQAWAEWRGVLASLTAGQQGNVLLCTDFPGHAERYFAGLD